MSLSPKHLGVLHYQAQRRTIPIGSSLPRSTPRPRHPTLRHTGMLIRNLHILACPQCSTGEFPALNVLLRQRGSGHRPESTGAHWISATSSQDGRPVSPIHRNMPGRYRCRRTAAGPPARVRCSRSVPVPSCDRVDGRGFDGGRRCHGAISAASGDSGVHRVQQPQQLRGPVGPRSSCADQCGPPCSARSPDAGTTGAPVAEYSVAAHAALEQGVGEPHLHYLWQRVSELALAYADLVFEVQSGRRRLPDCTDPGQVPRR